MVSPDCDTLTLTGIIYPPALQDGGHRTVGHLCEDFTVNELAQQLDRIRGLPVAVEHNMSELIGTVTHAQLTHANALQVTAVVKASTPTGKKAIDDIRNQKITGFSLSHEYHLFAKDGSPLQITLDKKGDWERIQHRKGDAEAVKVLRELSVCAEPARPGCHIHSIDGAPKVAAGLIEACKARMQPCRQAAAAAAPVAPGSVDETAAPAHKLCLVKWHVVSCSQNMSDKTDTPTSKLAEPSEQHAVSDKEREAVAAPTVAKTTAVPAAPTAVAAATAATAADPLVPKQAAEGAAAGAPAATDAAAPAPEAMKLPPAGDIARTVFAGNPDAVELAQSVTDMMASATAKLQAQEDEMKEQNRHLAQLQEEQRAATAAAESLVRKAQAERDASRAETEATRRQLEEAKAAALEKAQAGTHGVLEKLRHTLQAVRSASATTRHLPETTPLEPTADPTRLHQQIQNLAGQAISTVQELREQNQHSDMQASHAKRSRDNMLQAMEPFGGVVSANQESMQQLHKRPRTEPASDPGEQLRDWMATSKEPVTWSMATAKFNAINGACRQGVVSASAAAAPGSNTWARRSISEQRPVFLSAMQLQPEIWDELSRQMTGRTPTSSEVVEMCRSINVSNERMR